MFTEAREVIPTSLEGAVAALLDALAGDGLTAASSRAAADGGQFLMRVGPTAVRAFTKQVRVEVPDPHWVGLRFVAPLRWRATGPAGAWFPSLEANLTLAACEAQTELSVVAAYQPPLHGAGERLDRLVLSHAAAATVTSLTRQIAETLTAHAAPGRRRSPRLSSTG